MNRFEMIAGRMVEAWGPTMTLPRDFHIPGHAVNVQKVNPPGSDVEVYTYEDDGGKLFAVGFAGKSNKPLWHFRYRNEADRQKKIEETVSDRKSRADVMEQRRQERLNYRHDLKVGDILYSSWGYDQTNVDFYQVTAVGEKSVKIREIGGKDAGRDGVVANPGSFEGPEMTKVVGPGGRVRITSYATAGKWDGRAMYQTPFGMGH